ncbi:FUSC family protein [Castellaniella sp.]|uniref:FUSC family protein n=1 Tax=Castellaniella sp. TaxID=1955812 RepID=UPI002AFF8E77|nr:FUSC family protein [Castellaniella sp.]
MRTATLCRILQAELAPFDGRWSTAWRVAATCTLTVMVFMTYGIPLAAIGCYLVLFLMKPNPAETMLMALGICVLVALIVPVLFGATLLAIEYPVWRMAIIVVLSCFFMFLGAASQVGPAGGIIALVIVFVLTMLGEVPFGEVATRAILYAALMALVPMGVLLGFNGFFGLSVPGRLRQALAERLDTAAAALDSTDTNARDQILEILRTGDGELQKMALFIRLFHITPKPQTQALTQAITQTRDLLLAVAACAAPAHLAQQIRTDAALLRAGQTPALSYPDILSLAATPSNTSPLSHHGFFAADAWRNPLYVRYALKTTLAALICYWIYTAIQWQDIHTALITCYVGALGTTAETLHKLTLRITGCLIGAALGVASIYFFMPLMDSIGQLMVLVFLVTLLAAWVSTGSERSSYAGVQIGLAFLLTVLQGFGPDVQMDAAFYRVMGILLGNLVMYLVFTRIWSISATAAVRTRLQQVLDSLSPSAQRPHGPDAAQLQADIIPALQQLGQARTQLALSVFEPAHVRPNPTEITRLRGLLDELEVFYLRAVNPAGATPSITAMRRRLQCLLADTPFACPPACRPGPHGEST